MKTSCYFSIKLWMVNR